MTKYNSLGKFGKDYSNKRYNDRKDDPEFKELKSNQSKRFYKKHTTRVLEKCKKRRDDLRDQVLKAFGPWCANLWNCPIPSEKLDVRSLQIDHINNDGYEDRKKYKGRGAAYYKKVLAHQEDYQLLCPYCNWMKFIKQDKTKAGKKSWVLRRK
jgi:hypothetical protein